MRNFTRAIYIASVALCLNLSAYSQGITLKFKNITVKEAIEQLKEKSGYAFVFSSIDVNTGKRISVTANNATIEEIVKQILQGQNQLSYEIQGNKIVIKKAQPKPDNPVKKIKATGKVVDTNGDPVIGATVKEQGTSNGTISDMDGNFSFEVADNADLEVSYVGYQSLHIKVQNGKVPAIILKEDTETLDEVVVVGYGTMKKRDLTGAVSSISANKLKERSFGNALQSMAGQISGVQITQTQGAPGMAPTIKVRGSSSINAGTSPLYVIDGIPLEDNTGTNAAGKASDMSFNSNPLNNINPNDIESIEILKDASSAAIYGSRAAAGVILITTKRAKDKNFHLSYSLEYGIDAPPAKPRFANAVQWMQGYNELAYNDGASSLHSAYSEDLINNYAQLRAEDPDRYPDTDFMGMGIKSSTHHQRHSFSLSGGTEKLKTNFSLNYYNADALYDKKNYERFNVRSNNDYNINNWIHANVDVNLLYSSTVTPHSAEGSIIKDFMARSPLYNSYWVDGSYADGKDGDNPFALHDLGGTVKGQNYRINGKIQLDLTPIEGLTLTAIAAPQYTFYKGKDHKKKYDVFRISGDAIPGSGYATTSLNETRNDTHSLTMQFYANYKLQLKRHSIGLMAGYEDYSYNWENEGASRTNYSLVNFPYLNLGPEDYQYNSGNAGHNAYRSFFGRIMYSWADRYMLQANIRSDGSSRFADGHRWGTFPSVSAGWVISEEPWFNKSVINYLKLRGSIGQLGNERIGSEFPYQAKLTFGTGFIPNASTGSSDVVQTAYQTDYAFNTITWETTTTYGIGADITLLNNRLRASADYYYKKTTDMLMEVGFPSYFGYNAPQNNAADMNTKGWDLELSWSDQINDFRYGASFNISDYRSKMGYMANRQKIDGTKITEEGSYYNEWYGYKNLGIILNDAAMYDEDGNPIAVLTNNDKAGNIRYLDIDKDGKITASNDRVRLGNSLPELQYGGSLWAEWKNFDFNLSFQGIGHQLVYWSWPGTPFNYQAYACPLNLIENHWSPTATDAENAKAKYPKLTTNNTNIYANSDFYLFNGAYMRIKNITLGYTIPSEITKKFFVNKLRVYFSANDLPAFSKYPDGYDPEWDRSSDLIMSSYIFGLNVSF